MRRIFTTVFLCVALTSCTQFKQAVDTLPRWQQKPRSPVVTKDKEERIYTGEVMGVNENVSLVDASLPPLKAKLDTSIEITAMDVEVIDISADEEKSEKQRVTFRVHADGEYSEEFEREIVRWEHVVLASNQRTRRPVVVMDLCIGNERIKGEVSLAHKEHFLYPVLLGNNMLKNRIIVDDSKSFTSPPSCG